MTESALAAVLKAALEEAQRGKLEIKAKAMQDYVTDVDIAIDQRLSEALPKLIDVPVLSEERVIEADEFLELYWIVDPLDGTTNFIAGLPLWAVSVALVDCYGPLVAAVVKADGSAWTATRGKGARRDGEPLYLDDTPRTDMIVLSTGLLDMIQSSASIGSASYAALRRIGKIRNLGSQALHLCGVANGWFAAVCSKEARVWDEAAGGLILREAGGLWCSAADAADWRRPSALMALEQRSVAAHPRLGERVLAALGPLFDTDKAST